MIGVVLAGGSSSRFGGQPKGLMPLRGEAMLLRVARVLGEVCTRVVIDAAPSSAYAGLGLKLIGGDPRHDGLGPLAGIAAGLACAGGEGMVAFAPCDMPLLQPDVFRQLAAAGPPGAYPETPSGFEPLVCVIQAGVLGAVLTALAAAPLPRTHAVLDGAGLVRIRFPASHAFMNVNTPADRELAETLIGA